MQCCGNGLNLDDLHPIYILITEVLMAQRIIMKIDRILFFKTNF